jgi:hypothetical protein
MLNTAFDDFIWSNIDTLNKEDARLLDLDDKLLDEAVYIWLMTHKSWYTDIYPATINTAVGDIATEMLFGKTPVASRIVSNLFVAMAEDFGSDDRDDLWWTCAGDFHIDTIVNLGNFADEYKDNIYLYLEHSIEDFIFDRMAVMLENDKWERYDEE